MEENKDHSSSSGCLGKFFGIATVIFLVWFVSQMDSCSRDIGTDLYYRSIGH
jgi:hypothetical protein